MGGTTKKTKKDGKPGNGDVRITDEDQDKKAEVGAKEATMNAVRVESCCAPVIVVRFLAWYHSFREYKQYLYINIESKRS